MILRALIIIATFSCAAAFCAASQPLPPKIRVEVDKIDLQINRINHSLKLNLERSVELKNTIVGLREKVNEAKNPDNRERLDKSLSKLEQRSGDLKETTDAQFIQIRDLKTKRALIVAPILATEDIPRREKPTTDYSALDKIPETIFGVLGAMDSPEEPAPLLTR